MTALIDPVSGLSYGWALGENDWNTGMDSNLKQIGATIHINVAGIVATPSVTTNGTRYLVASGSGAFAGQSGKLAVRIEGAWVFYSVSDGTIIYNTADSKHYKVVSGVSSRLLQNFEYQLACSDLTTAITTGDNKGYFRAASPITLTAVRISLLTAQTSGSIFTVDIKKNGTTILSTLLTIDNGEKTSVTAATAAVISVTTIADDDEITVSVSQVGDGTAKGLIATLIGYK